MERMAKPRTTRAPAAAAGNTANDRRVVRPSRPAAAKSARSSSQPVALEPPARSEQPVAAPGAIITRRAADRLRAGHVWVYASDIQSLVPPGPDESLIPVADQRGLFLGTALYSPSSQIALRLVSRQPLDDAAWLHLLAARLRAAIARRKPLLDADNDACRLCFSEADELPGLVIDRYGDLIVLQLLAKGLLAAGVRETCVRVLREELQPGAIFERPWPSHPRARRPSRSVRRCALERGQEARHGGCRISSQRPRLSLRRAQRRPGNRRLSRSAH